MTQTSKKAVRIFFSYSHEDEELRDELAAHLSLLKRRKVIEEWYDRDVDAGEEWRDKIDAHLEGADIILLLVSADFLASDYCYNVEMKRAMERHEASAARVIPIILRPVVWEEAPFGKLQALPKDAKAVTSWANRDEAFADVVAGIRRAIKQGAAGHWLPIDTPTPDPRPWWARALLIAAVIFLVFIASSAAYYLFLRPELKVISDRHTEVYVDDRPVGETADNGILSQRVDYGQHSVKLVRKGFDPYMKARHFGLCETVRVKHYFVESGPQGVDFRKFEEVRERDKWVIPKAADWFVDKGRLLLKRSPDLIFPEKYNYGDFKLTLPLRLTNGRGAAWAVRVEDAGNYYLFYLAGPDNGVLAPGFYFYIVRDNKFAAKSYSDAAYPALAGRLVAGAHYEIIVTAEGNQIKNCISPVREEEGDAALPETEEAPSLGVFVDKDDWFTRGSIGFRTVGSEQFSIGPLYAYPAKQTPEQVKMPCPPK